MLIVSQDRKTLVNINSAGQIYTDNSIGHEKPHIYCDFGDGRTATLGAYESEKRCIEVLEDICGYYTAEGIFKMPEA